MYGISHETHYANTQRRVDTRTYMLQTLKNISREPIASSYIRKLQYKIGTDGVEWNNRIILRISFEVI